MVGVITDRIGKGFTVTTTVALEVQVPAVPTILYVVVLVGLAVTLVPLVPLSPVAGLHTYVVAPFAVKVVLFPVQIVADATVTVGVVTTVTVEVAVEVQLLVVPVTVYTCVAVGDTEIPAVFPPVLQAYPAAPLAFNEAVPPVQIVGLLTVTIGKGFTVTPAVAVLVQPATLVPVTI
jgi:hypothetical protein